MAGPNDLILAKENGTFGVWVQIQDGTEFIGDFPTLLEAIENFQESSHLWNHYVPPLDKVRFVDKRETPTSVADAATQDETRRVKAGPRLTKESLGTASNIIEKALRGALDKHGPLAFSSRHEILGNITEEYHELLNAIHKNEPWEKIENELADIALTCAAAIASGHVNNRVKEGL